MTNILKNSKFNLNYTEKGFAYLNLGYAFHYKPTHRIWVNRRVIAELANKEILQFPLKHVAIKKTNKGNYVIVPDEINNVFYIELKCGYRGSSKIEITSEVNEVIESKGYQSEVGNLGVNKIVLVSTPLKYVEFKWTRTGRLYGNPGNGKMRLNLDGTTIELTDDDELEELL